MATYSNQHWLLSHIRNSFISTDDTGMCETVMLSNDLPKEYLRKFQINFQSGRSAGKTKSAALAKSDRIIRNPDAPLQECDFVCYPGLDLSDDEDLDTSTHSFDIQMYPEVGAHRFRSNTAQKLEKLDIAKRKAARIKSINYNEEAQPPENIDFFKRKEVVPNHKQKTNTSSSSGNSHKKSPDDDLSDEGVQSKLTEQLAKSPKQTQNRFIEYARFDGTAQVGMPTKRINVYLSMLSEPERNYPLKICVISTAKIIEVIGFVCYKTSEQYPAVPLKSIQHYALYMTEDNDDMEDFPPLDNREPCSKFGFSHLTLAERRPLAPVTRVDYHGQLGNKSMTSEEDKSSLADAAVKALQNISLNNGQADPGGGLAGGGGGGGGGAEEEESVRDYEKRLLNHIDMLEAPIHRSFRLNLIDKRFFKSEVTLGISGERIEIDQLKSTKFWSQKKPISTPIDLVVHCEIAEKRQHKALLRIWLKSNSTSSSTFSASNCTSVPLDGSVTTLNTGGSGSGSAGIAHSPSSPNHSTLTNSSFLSSNIRFKHYDFDTDSHMAEQISNKLNCILEMRSSPLRREFLHQRERKLEKQLSKKQLKS
ncbi:stress-activated map kinase-interacting protein 1 [Drosophila tropicalis]|uniref:stress-activated map kinase-interacting protein 1 n=1 Tax=Drosophila tropicalis TaxID=46794 RepID=UPI0035AB732C